MVIYDAGDKNIVNKQVKHPPSYLRWPHMHADQVHGLGLREIGGGFAKHHRAPSMRFASYAIAKPSTMVQKMQNIKKLRGHRDAVYCGMTSKSVGFYCFVPVPFRQWHSSFMASFTVLKIMV